MIKRRSSVSSLLKFVYQISELGADEHGRADGSAGVPAHEGVHGEPGGRDC